MVTTRSTSPAPDGSGHESAAAGDAGTFGFAARAVEHLRPDVEADHLPRAGRGEFDELFTGSTPEVEHPCARQAGPEFLSEQHVELAALLIRGGFVALALAGLLTKPPEQRMADGASNEAGLEHRSQRPMLPAPPWVPIR